MRLAWLDLEWLTSVSRPRFVTVSSARTWHGRWVYRVIGSAQGDSFPNDNTIYYETATDLYLNYLLPPPRRYKPLLFSTTSLLLIPKAEELPCRKPLPHCRHWGEIQSRCSPATLAVGNRSQIDSTLPLTPFFFEEFFLWSKISLHSIDPMQNCTIHYLRPCMRWLHSRLILLQYMCP